jgi:hypothetical protein
MEATNAIADREWGERRGVEKEVELVGPVAPEAEEEAEEEEEEEEVLELETLAEEEDKVREGTPARSTGRRNQKVKSRKRSRFQHGSSKELSCSVAESGISDNPVNMDEHGSHLAAADSLDLSKHKGLIGARNRQVTMPTKGREILSSDETNVDHAKENKKSTDEDSHRNASSLLLVMYIHFIKLSICELSLSYGLVLCDFFHASLSLAVLIAGWC